MSLHWSLCFLVSPCYWQDAMPYQCSSSNLPRVLRIWKSVFFTLNSFLLVLRLLWEPAVQASCWSFKHSPGPTIRLNHNSSQKRYGGRFFLRVAAGQLMKNLPLAGFEPYNRWTCQKPPVLSVRRQSHAVWV